MAAREEDLRKQTAALEEVIWGRDYEEEWDLAWGCILPVNAGPGFSSFGVRGDSFPRSMQC